MKTHRLIRGTAARLALALGMFVLGNAETLAGTSDRELASVAQLQATGADWNAFPVLHVESYFAGAGVGGGDFARATCTPDGGNCIADGTVSAHSFKRINPRWDAAEYGIVGNGTSDITARMTALFAAAQAAGVNTVTVKQAGQYYFGANFTVPTGMYLQCGAAGAVPAVDVSNNNTGDHKDYPYLLLHASGTTFTIGAGAGVSPGCVVENKATYDSPNPTTVQSRYNISGNGTNAGTFGGTGVTCGGDGCRYAGGMILGFTTGFSTDGNDNYDISNTTIDGTNCIYIANSRFLIGRVRDVKCSGMLTLSTTGQTNYDIDGIAASPSTSANYRFHLAAPCDPASGNCPFTGNIVWIGTSSSGARPIGVESAAGRCTVLVIDNSNFECTNTQTAATVTVGNVTLGSTRICGIANMLHVRELQQVSGTDIPSGATVARANTRGGCIKLDSAHPATATASISDLTFTDNAYSGSDHYFMRPYVNHRFGTGIVLNNVHNNDLDGFLIVDYDVHLLLEGGSQDNSITGCHIEEEVQLLDSIDIGLDIEDASANYIQCPAIHVGGNQATAILNNQGGAGAEAANTILTTVIGTSNWADQVLDDELGNLNFQGSAGNAGNGSIFVADGIKKLNICNSISTHTDLIFQSSVAEGETQNCGSYFNSGTAQQQGTFTSLLTAAAGGGQTNATHTSTDIVRVNVVASAGDSVRLRSAIAGRCQKLINDTAHDMQVFGADTDTINGHATGTGISQATKTIATYCSAITGNSYQSISPLN